jgi:hypothetical protein
VPGRLWCSCEKNKVEEIRATLDMEHRTSFADLRGRLGLLPIVWIGMGLPLLQQLVGINVIFYYVSAIQPDIQYVINPAGTREIDDAFLAGAKIMNQF